MDHEERIKNLEQRTTLLWLMRLCVLGLALISIGTDLRVRDIESKLGAVKAPLGWPSVKRVLGYDRPLAPTEDGK
jgi:hypothetical protein